MALTTDGFRNGLKRHKDTSAADTAVSVSTAAPLRGKTQKFLWASVKYSAAPVQTGVTIEIDSGAGAAFDALILTGNADDTNVFFEPDGGELFIATDDKIKVTAPAGGGVITATVVVMMQETE